MQLVRADRPGSLLQDAAHPSIIVPGALILVGEHGDPDDPVAVCRIVELEEVNSHMVVRFENLPGTPAQRRRTTEVSADANIRFLIELPHRC